MTNSLSEVEFYDALFVIGSNTTEAHPVIGGKMKRAVRDGAHLIVADPRRTELADLAELWLQLDPRDRCRAGERHDEHNHQRGLAGSGVHRRPLRELRRPVGRRAEIHARSGQRDHRRACGQALRGRPYLLSDAARGHLLYPGHHRAHDGDGQRHRSGQPGHDHRARGRTPRRGQPPTRPEQRAGRLRHGCAPQRVLRLPPGHQARERGGVRKGLGRGTEHQIGSAHPGDVRRHPGRRRQGHVHHGRGPRPHRRRRQPRTQGHIRVSTSWWSRTSS